ncbi:hypothetical protein VTJ04DRAFT_8933 [Mycothermus thermophilus]|uniref:uncharacterized protein n=1 Tax=Humicola insolens TaxID=85995 RepID=UPI003742F0C9
MLNANTHHTATSASKCTCRRLDALHTPERTPRFLKRSHAVLILTKPALCFPSSLKNAEGTKGKKGHTPHLFSSIAVSSVTETHWTSTTESHELPRFHKPRLESHTSHKTPFSDSGPR